MNKMIIIFSLFLSLSSYADSARYNDSLSYYSYNEIFKSLDKHNIRIKYDTVYKEFEVYIDRAGVTTNFSLSRKSADKIITAISKYEKWNKKATSNEIKLQKKIDTINLLYHWNTGEKNWFSGDISIIELIFFSQSTKRHQFVISFPKTKDIENKYISIKPDNMFFDLNQIIAFKDALSAESVNLFLLKYKNKKKILNEFN